MRVDGPKVSHSLATWFGRRESVDQEEIFGDSGGLDLDPEDRHPGSRMDISTRK